MRTVDLIRDVFHTLWSHKLRTMLTMFGIGWGIVSIVVMVAAGEGLRAGQAKQAANFGKDILILFGGRSSMQVGGQRAGRVVHFVDQDIAPTQAETPDCQNVIPELGQGDVKTHSAFNNASFGISGSYPEFGQMRAITVAEGRYFDWNDEHERRRVAILGSEVKPQLFPNTDALGKTIYMNSIPYTVVGVMQKKDQNSSYDGPDVRKIFIPFAAIRQDFPDKPPGTPYTVDRLLATPKSLQQHLACKQELRAVLGRLHGFDPRDKEACFIWDTVEGAKAFQQMTDGMKYFLGGVGIVTLLLGGIGVMNVMLVAVRERTREIGVRKALGAPSSTILRQFFLEALVIAFVSGAMGLSVAYGLCALVNLIPMPPFFAGLIATWQSGALALALLGTIAILAAMYPARQAASIDPIEALRYEAGG